MDWLVKDQNLLQGVPRTDDQAPHNPSNVVLTRQPDYAKAWDRLQVDF